MKEDLQVHPNGVTHLLLHLEILLISLFINNCFKINPQVEPLCHIRNLVETQLPPGRVPRVPTTSGDVMLSQGAQAPGSKGKCGRWGAGPRAGTGGGCGDQTPPQPRGHPVPGLIGLLLNLQDAPWPSPNPANLLKLSLPPLPQAGLPRAAEPSGHQTWAGLGCVPSGHSAPVSSPVLGPCHLEGCAVPGRAQSWVGGKGLELLEAGGGAGAAEASPPNPPLFQCSLSVTWSPRNPLHRCDPGRLLFPERCFMAAQVPWPAPSPSSQRCCLHPFAHTACPASTPASGVLLQTQRASPHARSSCPL